MSKYQDTVLFVKNLFKMNNVYDCARPLQLVLGLVGVGATWRRKTDGVYSLHNTNYSALITVLITIFTPILSILTLVSLLHLHSEMVFGERVYSIIMHFVLVLNEFTVTAGYLMTYVSRKRLDRLFKIIHNIDCQLEEVNINVQHWKIILKVTVIALVTIHYIEMTLQLQRDTFDIFFLILIIIHLIFIWIILLMLIIHERFVCLNKVLQETGIPFPFPERNLRDNYVLRRIKLARHVHEQLTEVVQLFSDTCRYMVLGLLAESMVYIILQSILDFILHYVMTKLSILTAVIRIIVLIFICQMNKNERRILTAKLRHLLAFETDREVIQQVQQYIMFNAYTPPSPVDLQFSDMDNVLLLTIINVIASNMLIIYSYTRQWT